MRTQARSSALASGHVAEVRELPASAGSWLDVLVRLLDIPESDRASIRDELEAHLDERTRDLIIDGVSPERALAVAVGELGETAVLAQRFNDAFRQPLRRRIMHLSLISAGFGALGLGFLAFTGTPSLPTTATIESSVFVEDAVEHAPDLLQTRMSLQLLETPLAQLFEYTKAVTGANMYVHWNQFEDNGVDRDAVISIELENVSLQRAFDLVGDQIEQKIAWWYEDELLEIAPREYLDERSVTLVSYDIRPTLDVLVSEYGMDYEGSQERISTVLQEFVSTEDWADMGGRLAHLQFVGGRLFIQAPTRMHQKIAWVLDELSAAQEDGEE